MRDLAERGYLAVVVQMPFNFAFFDINAADRVRADFPDVGTWWVGGHSLGGSMAAQYASTMPRRHARRPRAVGILLRQRPVEHEPGRISLYGSNDQMLNRAKLEDNADLLPKGAETVEIEGGNHAGFGAYGPQSGDGEAASPPRNSRAKPPTHRPLHQARYAEPSLAAAA